MATITSAGDRLMIDFELVDGDQAKSTGGIYDEENKIFRFYFSNLGCIPLQIDGLSHYLEQSVSYEQAREAFAIPEANPESEDPNDEIPEGSSAYLRIMFDGKVYLAIPLYEIPRLNTKACRIARQGLNLHAGERMTVEVRTGNGNQAPGLHIQVHLRKAKATSQQE